MRKIICQFRRARRMYNSRAYRYPYRNVGNYMCPWLNITSRKLDFS